MDGAARNVSIVFMECGNRSRPLEAAQMNRDAAAFKIRQIFLPALLLSVSFAIGYSLLHWLFVAKTGWVPLDEDVVALWLPGGLAWILVIWLIQPRLRYLNLRDKRNNLPFLFHFAAVAVVAVPALVAQGYVRTATGNVTHVHDASLIATSARSKFYVADSICMHIYRPISKGFVETSGKQNETLNFNVYVMAPVCSTDAAAAPQTITWLGLRYHRSMSTSASAAAKDSAYNLFLRESLEAFNAEDPRRYQFLENIGRNAGRKRFEKTLQAASYTLAAPTILIPHLEAFELRTGNRLQWSLVSFLVGPLVWLAMIMIPKLDHAKVKQASDPAHKPSHARAMWPNFIIPRRQSYGLALLVDINLAVFIAMMFAGLGVMSFGSDDLMAWGANYRPAIHGWGLLRLVTSQFVHGGLMHLVNNLYGLLFAGLFLSVIVPNWRLIVCYLLCGLGGSIASVWMHPNTMSVGASGAIFGLFGMLLTLVLLGDARLAVVRSVVLVNAGIFVGLNLLIGAASVGIDNAAHVGGLVTGVVLGLGFFLVGHVQGSRVGHRAEAPRVIRNLP
jgi:rhomboid protease GluP